jgi:hypothetical protein
MRGLGEKRTQKKYYEKDNKKTLFCVLLHKTQSYWSELIWNNVRLGVVYFSQELLIPQELVHQKRDIRVFAHSTNEYSIQLTIDTNDRVVFNHKNVFFARKKSKLWDK